MTFVMGESVADAQVAPAWAAAAGVAPAPIPASFAAAPAAEAEEEKELTPEERLEAKKQARALRRRQKRDKQRATWFEQPLTKETWQQ